ncbi:SCO family protein [Dongia deserti]|uniref:SCO family protein n=1 Tax=Dongia deserti TaxID=2268030 RepID=UPI002547B0CE|nr:SCO family protein [Dongia deserti]
MNTTKRGPVNTMRLIARCLLALAMMMTPWSTAFAHSIDETAAMLGGKEKYFQPIDKVAPNFTLRDADDRIFRLADFRNKVIVLHFVYTHCPDVCPLHAERIAQIQTMIKQGHMQDRVQFITITTDPSRDTQQVLRDYGKVHGLKSANWLFLTTTADQPEDETRRLAESFGHKFTKEKDGYQMHGIVTHVVDREGRWRANFHGLEFDPTNMVVFVNALINDVHPEPAEQGGFWGWLKSLF